MLNSKALWVEDLDDAPTHARVMQQVTAIGANLLCVRTTSPLLAGLIPTFHQMGIRVYGWRWARVVQNQPQHGYAKDEADFVAQTLIPAGLDGYIFDVESDENGSAHDWDRTDVGDLSQLATYYTQTIKKAADKSARPFLLGLTSHARGFSNYPKIPWGPFLDVAQVLFPQTYWRYYKDQAHGCVDENKDANGKGTPDQALANGYADYKPKNKAIIPVAGELRCATDAEIQQFGVGLHTKDLVDGHFYVSDSNISTGVLAAIKNL